MKRQKEIFKMGSEENKTELSVRDYLICLANKDTKKHIEEKNDKEKILKEWLKRIKEDPEHSSYITSFVIVAIILAMILGSVLGAPVIKEIGPKSPIILLIYGFIIPMVTLTIFGLSYKYKPYVFKKLIKILYSYIKKVVKFFSESEEIKNNIFFEEDNKNEAVNKIVNETMCLITQCFFCSFFIFAWFSSYCYWILNDDDFTKGVLLDPPKPFEYCLKVASLGVLNHPHLPDKECTDKTKSNKESKKYSQEWASFYLNLFLIWIILPRLSLLAFYIIRYRYAKSIEIDLSKEPFSSIIFSALKEKECKIKHGSLLDRKNECVKDFDELKKANPGSISKDDNSAYEDLKKFFENKLEGKDLVDKEIVKEAENKLDTFEDILNKIKEGTEPSKRIVGSVVASRKEDKCVVITTIDLISNLTNLKEY